MDLFRVEAIGDAFWNQFAANPATRPMQARLRECLADVPNRLPMPTACDYLAARRDNRRDILDRHWQQDRSIFARLVVDRLISSTANDDRLLNWIFDLTFEACWSVSAHLPNLDLQRAAEPTLDLASCELASELAETREALQSWMRQRTGTLDMSIVDEIDRRVLTPFIHGNRWWDDPATEVINNWSGVCAGAVLNACLSLEAQGFARPEAKRKAIETLHLFWNRAFTKTGECDEGPGYWGYGVAYGCLPLMRLTPEQIAADFDVTRIRAVASYLERAHIFKDHFLATNDSVSRVHAQSWFAPWIAEFADSSFLRWWSVTYPASSLRSINTVLRECHAVTRPAAVAPAAPAPIPARYLEDQQIAIWQRSTSGQLFTFALGGGNNAESHNHNDLGAFQLFLDDTPWILDIGQPHYRTDFFGPHRYERYIAAASSGHCCPAVNGLEQVPGAAAAGSVLSENVQAGRLALDLTSAYPREANLRKWHRSAEVPAGLAEARITDLFELSSDGVFTHRIWFRERPKVSGNLITCGPVAVQLDRAPEACRVLEFDAGDDRMLLREFPAGHLLYRVDMDYRALANRSCRIETTIRVS